jgi:hypothetical protein
MEMRISHFAGTPGVHECAYVYIIFHMCALYLYYSGLSREQGYLRASYHLIYANEYDMEDII